jgi:hypothetical protein
MKVGLVGPSYQQRSLPFDAQRTINLYPVFDEQGKEIASLYGTPGLSYFGMAGSGPIRKGFSSTNGRAFFVSGDKLYEIDSAGVTTSRGTLNTSSGSVTIEENSTQLFICDGDDGYVFTYSSNAFAVVSDVDFPSAGTCTFIGGYFVVNQNNTGKFYISSLNNGTTWAALDFATAESSPDNLKRVIRGVGQLWLLGDKTTEIWSNSGAASFPFERISGAETGVGILAPHSAIEFASSVFWVAKSSEGSGTVVRATSYTPQRISTEAIEYAISRATDPEDIYAWAYQQEGHDFYVLSGGGLETSLVYDLTTGLWHERAFLDIDGSFSQHIGRSCIFAFNRHLVGDRRNGNVYILSQSVYDDNTNPIARERIFTHLSSEGAQVRYNKLTLGFETGVGLQSGQGSSPLVSLRLSKDGARTWSDSYTADIGAVGKYQTNVTFRRLGIADQMTFRIRVTDPVKIAITGSYLE